MSLKVELSVQYLESKIIEEIFDYSFLLIRISNLDIVMKNYNFNKQLTKAFKV